MLILLTSLLFILRQLYSVPFIQIFMYQIVEWAFAFQIFVIFIYTYKCLPLSVFNYLLTVHNQIVNVLAGL